MGPTLCCCRSSTTQSNQDEEQQVQIQPQKRSCFSRLTFCFFREQQIPAKLMDRNIEHDDIEEQLRQKLKMQRYPFNDLNEEQISLLDTASTTPEFDFKEMKVNADYQLGKFRADTEYSDIQSMSGKQSVDEGVIEVLSIEQIRDKKQQKFNEELSKRLSLLIPQRQEDGYIDVDNVGGNGLEDLESGYMTKRTNYKTSQKSKSIFSQPNQLQSLDPQKLHKRVTGGIWNKTETNRIPTKTKQDDKCKINNRDRFDKEKGNKMPVEEFCTTGGEIIEFLDFNSSKFEEIRKDPVGKKIEIAKRMRGSKHQRRNGSLAGIFQFKDKLGVQGEIKLE